MRTNVNNSVNKVENFQEKIKFENELYDYKFEYMMNYPSYFPHNNITSMLNKTKRGWTGKVFMQTFAK